MSASLNGLAAVRAYRRLTQGQIAAAMGITQARVSKIERTWSSVGLPTLVAYLKACGVDQLTLTADIGGEHLHLGKLS